MASQGDVYWIPSGSHGIEHVHVVASDPSVDAQNVVLIPVTTRDGYVDETCVLSPGDHKCITHDSCVDYRSARVLPAARIDAAHAARRIRKADPVSNEVLKRIFDGASRTIFLPGDCDRILHQQGFIN